MSDTPRTDNDRDSLAEGWYLRGILDHYCAVCGRDVDECQDWQTYSQTKHETLRGTDWLAAHDAEVRRQALADAADALDELKDEERAAVDPDGPRPDPVRVETFDYAIDLAAESLRLRAAVDAADPTAHDRAVRAEAWELGRRAGFSVAMRRMSDEPNAPDPVNPYRADTIEGADHE